MPLTLQEIISILTTRGGNQFNLVSVVKMGSLCVENRLSLSFKKPNSCTRYITWFCVTKEQS